MHHRLIAFAGILIMGLTLSSLPGCASLAGNVALGAGGTTALGGMIPNGGIEQTYYLGIFDPRDQMKPPQFYRVKVRGQSSVLNTTKFASGWVRADMIDSLSSPALKPIDVAASGVASGDASRIKISNGRRLILFGPEGFREAPADHRLVIVMGANPEKFFSAIDESLGMIARVTQLPAAGTAPNEELFATLATIRAERARLGDLLTAIQAKGE